MDLEIERLSLQVAGGTISPGRAQRLGELVGVAFQELLSEHAPDLAARPDGHRVSFLAVPDVNVDASASDDALARAVADAVARAVLRELEVWP